MYLNIEFLIINRKHLDIPFNFHFVHYATNAVSKDQSVLYTGEEE